MAKAFAKLKFRLLSKHIYGTKPLWRYSVMLDTVLCQRYGITGGIKQMRTHNIYISENGRSARVAFCSYPTRTRGLRQIYVHRH
jgi:hypothetical protein